MITIKVFGSSILHQDRLLPTLPPGWVYEGWVAGPDGPVFTGIFLSANGADSDGAGPAAGPNGTPPFPGQDFINPAKVIVGRYLYRARQLAGAFPAKTSSWSNR